MRLFSNILNTRAQLGTRILQKNKNKTKKIQIMQNKCIRFCLRVDKMDHIQGRSDGTWSVAFEVLIINRQTYSINSFSFNYLTSNFCFPKKSILHRQKRMAVMDARPYFWVLNVPGKMMICYLRDTSKFLMYRTFL